MSIDLPLALAGALAGFLVGLTGMGGGALLTPLLVLAFGVPPLAAVSSDLVTSLVMKPFAGAVHLARGTVDLRLFAWLAAGSAPAAFAASYAIGRLAEGSHAAAVQPALRLVIGAVLLVSVAGTVGRLVLDARRGAPGAAARPDLRIRPLTTVLIGVVGGLAVGLTSVGAGTLVLALLMLAYPGLRAGRLVGTDILQAIPLVGSAALGHALFGAVQLSLTGSLLVGAIPGAIVGARASAAAPDAVVRPVMAMVLAGSALALFGTPSWGLLLGSAGAGLVVFRVGRVGAAPVPGPEPGDPHVVGIPARA